MATDCGGLLPVLADREEKPALREARDGVIGPWITRAELRVRVGQAAERLGSDKKALVFLMVRNDAESVVALLAARAAGHAVALLDAKASPETLDALIALYDPDFVIEGGSILRRDVQAPAGLHSDLAILLSTSGTTGSAKFVRLGEEAILSNAGQIAEALHIREDDVGVAHLALHYSYGLSVLTSHLVVGASVLIIDDSLMSPTFWRTIEQAGGTHFPGVPFHYTTIARLGLERLAPACIRTFTQAGGALDLRFQRMLHEQATARGAAFYVMYGQTEAGPRIATLQSADFSARMGSVGVALSGGTISVEGTAGEPLPPGEEGEVIYSGPNVMLGYAETRADLHKGDERSGRLVTGDLGYLDADGYLFLTGRTKRISKLFGLRISLDDIEQRLGCVGCAAIDTPEKIVIFHEPADLSAALDRLADELGLPPSALRGRHIEALPRLASGKTDYTALKELL